MRHAWLAVLTLVIVSCAGVAHAQEPLCPDGQRSYFGVCPDGAPPSPQPTPRPAPSYPAPAPAVQLPEMVSIPAGEFMMGSTYFPKSATVYTFDSPEHEPNSESNEFPQHKVHIGVKFAVSRYPVTVGEFAQFVAETNYDAGNVCDTFPGSSPSEDWADQRGRNWRKPGFSQTDRSPVVCVNFNDALAYAAWLSRRTGHSYRLLTEAEYEYVARAGTTNYFWWGETVGSNHANCGQCGSAWDGKQTSPVGSFSPNPFGLFDIVGNVWSWVQDCRSMDYKNAPVDGQADTTGDCSLRESRGGSWVGTADQVRSAYRDPDGTDPGLRVANMGFRVARTD